PNRRCCGWPATTATAAPSRSTRRTDMEQDTGLAKRGILLLALMAALAAVVLTVLLRGGGERAAPEARPRPESVAVRAAPPPPVFLAALPGPALVRPAEDLPSPAGWKVRYSAAIALARRGSRHVPLDLLREMLDEERQLRNCRVRLKDGREVPDEGEARRIVVNALKAVAAWHEHPDAVKSLGTDPRLQAVYAAVDQLARSPNLALRKEAEATRARLKRPAG